MIEIIAIIALTNDSNVNKINNIFILPYFYCILFCFQSVWNIWKKKRARVTQFLSRMIDHCCHFWVPLQYMKLKAFACRPWRSRQKPVVFEKIRKWPQKPRGQRCEMSDICSITLILLSWNWPLLNYCQNRWRANQTFINLSLINEMCISSHFMTKQW